MSKKYYHIGPAEVEKLCGDPQELIDALCFSVSIYDGIEKYNEWLRNFTEPQKYVFAVMWYLAEVNNGGHDQFFYNSTGIMWRDALDGLKKIGCGEAAHILTEAVCRIGGEPPFEREERWKVLERYEADFDDLDRGFYDIDLFPYLEKYIKENEEAFYIDREIEMLFD